jgi:hypothetical protein
MDGLRSVCVSYPLAGRRRRFLSGPPMAAMVLLVVAILLLYGWTYKAPYGLPMGLAGMILLILLIVHLRGH